MAKRKAHDIAEVAYKAAKGEYGKSWYRRRNDPSTANLYEFNVGKWFEEHWCSDCLGFVHIMVNGFHDDKSKLGGGAVMDDFVNLSDEKTTLNKYCRIKGHFPHKNAKESTLLQTPDHVGLYIGESFNSKYNTAECTMAKGGGWVLTWTDMSNGNRYTQKGGAYLSTWSAWGEFDRVDYDDDEEREYPKVPFLVKVNITDLFIRSGASISKPTKGYAKKGNHSIVKVSGDWGKLASGGWIYIANPSWVTIGKHFSVTAVAKQVIDGKYGVMPERKKKLEKAGYDYRTIQNKVNDLLRK